MPYYAHFELRRAYFAFFLYGLPYEALAKYGCGGGATLGSSLGPVGTITGIIIGGLIGFLVNKCARKTDHKYDGLLFNDVTGETNKVPIKTVDDIIGECEPFKEQRSTKQYIKAGS